MSETKWTPWRWEFDDDTDRVRVYGTVAENPLREELVCEVGNYSSDVEQMEAWGALIAAAPDLYEALSGAMPSIKMMLTCATHGDWRGVLIESAALNNHVPTLNAALAKAVAGTPQATHTGATPNG